MTAKTLSNLEQEVMSVVWEQENCSVRDVLEIINQTRQLAYTTIATVLQRLHDKGLVKKIEDQGTIMYSARVSKERYSRNIAQSFMQKLVTSFGDIAIASFAQSVDSLPEAKRKYFLELLDQYDKKA